MNLTRLAKAYLRQAEARLKDAKGARRERNNPYALRLSQECVELCVKATLRMVGIEYPKEHEVSDLLADVKERLPLWFVQEIPYIQENSKSLFKKRELAFYGGEEALLSPDDVINAEDASRAVRASERIFVVCSKIVDEIKGGAVSISGR